MICKHCKKTTKTTLAISEICMHCYATHVCLDAKPEQIHAESRAQAALMREEQAEQAEPSYTERLARFDLSQLTAGDAAIFKLMLRYGRGLDCGLEGTVYRTTKRLFEYRKGETWTGFPSSYTRNDLDGWLVQAALESLAGDTPCPPMLS